MSSDEIQSRWSVLTQELIADPDNFAKWELLVQVAEGRPIDDASKPSATAPPPPTISKLSPPQHLEILRASYNAFLTHFPLCTQYWIKYAQWEYKLGHTTRALQVYEQPEIGALAQLPYDLDLWLAYLRFKLISSLKEDPLDLLPVFERARQYIGCHFHAHEFYALYLDYLQQHSEYDRSMERIYYVLMRLVLEVPLFHYATMFQRFWRLIDSAATNERTLSLLVPERERNHFPAGSPKTVAKLKKIFTNVYVATQYKVYQLYQFERDLPRQYFHVTYVSQQQLETWSSYLDFLELNNHSYPPELVRLAYERCVVATALYERFWSRFADYCIAGAGAGAGIEAAKQVLSRGIVATPMTNYKLKLKLVDLEIYQGHLVKARDIVLANLRISPDFVPFIVKLISIERALNHSDDEYLLRLVRKFVLQLVATDAHAVLFNEILHYPVQDAQQMLKFFESFESTPQIHCFAYWNAYMEAAKIARAEPVAVTHIYEHATASLANDENAKFAAKWRTYAGAHIDYTSLFKKSLIEC
ncbi:Suppressor of forked domain-containing protein [[Candida] zeylanoides]